MARKKTSYAEMIQPDKLPRHIAIIMDGNGRWAQKRLLPRSVGHRAGMKSLKTVVRACDKFGIKNLTVFAFSTENWKRPFEEIDFLMKLLVEFLHREIDELHQNNVKINILGECDPLPTECRQEIDAALQLTRENTGLVFNIALNYGSRKEILTAIKYLAVLVAAGDIDPKGISEETLSNLLYTRGIPDPDLLIRTAGEMRISNFLLWQIAYAEIWVTDCLWPDFTGEDLARAICDYQQRERRYGGINREGQDEINV